MGFRFARAHLHAIESDDAVLAALRASLAAVEPKLVFVFASPARELDAVARAATAAFPKALVVGATSAGEFTESGDARKSCVVLGLGGEMKAIAGIGRGLRKSPERAVREAVEKLPRKVSGYPYATAFLLLDPLAGNGEEVALLAGAALGDGVRLAGGAAGDDLAMKTASVLFGTRVEQDAVVVVLLFSKAPVAVGVAHAHRPFSNAMRVTRAEGSVVFEIDGRPAWEVWKDVSRERAKAAGYEVDALAPEEQGAFLLRFEAGLAAGSSYKIRAPLSVEAGHALRFATAVPVGTELHVTESEVAQQVDSAVRAAKQARQALGARSVAGALVFDCVCRRLILQERFGEALTGISAALGDAPIVGLETYGEIALGPTDMSGFHNSTSVVVAFSRER